MGIKRTDIDWEYDYLSEQEEQKEISRITEQAISTVEWLIDILYKDDPAKAISEWLRVIQRIREMWKYAQWIDRYKQQLAMFLIHYEK